MGWRRLLIHSWRFGQIRKCDALQLSTEKCFSSTSTKLPETKPPSKTEKTDVNNNSSKTDKTVDNVVYQPGPLSSVNNGNGDNKTEKKIRYLPGYLSSTTIQEMWTPQVWFGDYSE